jgi:hypothetical protein
VTALSFLSTSCKKAKVSLTLFVSFTISLMFTAYSDFFVKHDHGNFITVYKIVIVHYVNVTERGLA